MVGGRTVWSADATNSQKVRQVAWGRRYGVCRRRGADEKGGTTNGMVVGEEKIASAMMWLKWAKWGSEEKTRR